jgi:tRNA (guanine37-N1)-methyltransferase
LDLFCGIGPFSLRAAKDLGAVCMANDLNPECYKFLKQNIEENKLQHLVTPLNMDAREVVLKIYNKELEFHFNHVYMNLPVLAIDFLDVFGGFTHKTGRVDLPYIHVYGFAKGKDDE